MSGIGEGSSNVPAMNIPVVEEKGNDISDNISGGVSNVNLNEGGGMLNDGNVGQGNEILETNIGSSNAQSLQQVSIETESQNKEGISIPGQIFLEEEEVFEEELLEEELEEGIDDLQDDLGLTVPDLLDDQEPEGNDQNISTVNHANVEEKETSESNQALNHEVKAIQTSQGSLPSGIKEETKIDDLPKLSSMEKERDSVIEEPQRQRSQLLQPLQAIQPLQAHSQPVQTHSQPQNQPQPQPQQLLQPLQPLSQQKLSQEIVQQQLPTQTQPPPPPPQQQQQQPTEQQPATEQPPPQVQPSQVQIQQPSQVQIQQVIPEVKTEVQQPPQQSQPSVLPQQQQQPQVQPSQVTPEVQSQQQPQQAIMNISQQPSQQPVVDEKTPEDIQKGQPTPISPTTTTTTTTTISENKEEVEGEGDSVTNETSSELPPMIDVLHKDERWNRPVHQGMGWKWGTNSFSKDHWRFRFFILNSDGKLWYFKNGKAKNPRKSEPVEIKGVGFWKSFTKRNCLQLGTGERPFYFLLNSPEEMEKWIEMFSGIGAKFYDLHLPGHFDHDFLSKSSCHMKSWKTDQVKDFFDFIHLNSKQTALGLYNEQLKVIKNGQKLMTFNSPEKWYELGIKDVGHVHRIVQEVKDWGESSLPKKKGKKQPQLQTQKKRQGPPPKLFLKNFYVALKVQKLAEIFGFKFHDVQQRRICSFLSDPELMCETYLSNESFDLFDSTNFDKRDEQNKDSLILEIQPPDLSPEFLQSQIPIKIYLTEMAFLHDPKVFSPEELFSPTLSSVPRFRPSQVFGPFHLVLIIGPFYVEWNESGLIIPKRIPEESKFSDILVFDASTTVVLSAPPDDKDDDDGGSGYRRLKYRIAEFICKWNCRHLHSLPVKKQKTIPRFMTEKIFGNCVHFVEDFFHEFRLNPILPNRLPLEKYTEGGFSKFLGKMKVTGTCEMEFEPSRGFIKEFMDEEEAKELRFNKTLKFESHEELDEFINSITEDEERKEKFFNEKKYESRILSYFCRAFWLRHIWDTEKQDGESEAEGGNLVVDPRSLKYRPAKNCPYEDPRKPKL